MTTPDDARYAGRCGNTSPSGRTCTRPGGHDGPHQETTIGGPDDGHVMASWFALHPGDTEKGDPG
jgi:hypothetical protein